MALNFVKEAITIGADKITDKTFTFFKQGFRLNGAIGEPDYRDVTVSGVDVLNLPNAKADGLNYCKLYGKCEKDFTPEPITIDGVEVFSGNKTGIDSYTINGSTVEIPYTESLSGIKIVDSAYLNRVLDVKNELSITPYIVIDNANQTATDYRSKLICNNGELKVNNYNAINISNIQNGFIGNQTIGTEIEISASTSSVVIKKCIKVIEGKSYFFSYTSNITGARRYSYTDDNNLVINSGAILNCEIGLNEYTIVAPITGWLWVTVQAGDMTTVNPICYEIDKIYIDGITETVKDSLNNIATAENLLAVDTYKDVQEVLSGEIIRNCEAFIYDGTQTITTPYISNTGRVEKGAIIVRPKVTPTTSTVTAQTLTTKKGSNTIEITQASLTDLPIEVNYMAGVSVTVTQIENENLDNQVTAIIGE